MFDVSSHRLEIKKWIPQFERMIGVVFFVDISQYDQVILEESDHNSLMEGLVQFDSVVNSRWVSHTCMILLFCNARRFREKLNTIPLSHYFPDYSGGNDINKASKYLLSRFNQVNRVGLNVYPHLCEPSSESIMGFIWTAVRETILVNVNKDLSIL